MSGSLKYSEDYTAQATTNKFTSRNIWYAISITKTNPTTIITMYTPRTSAHFNSSGSQLKNFTSFNSQPGLFPSADYIGDLIEKTAVSYNKNTTNYAQTAIMVNVDGALPFSQAVKVNLGTTKSNPEDNYIEYGANVDYMKLGQVESKLTNILLDGGDITQEEADLAVDELCSSGLTNEVATEAIAKYINFNRTDAISQDDINNSIAVNNSKVREAIKSTTNYEDYLEFISGTGLTEDEYWDQLAQLQTLQYNQ